MEKKHVKLAMLNTFECSSVKYCMIIRQQGVFGLQVFMPWLLWTLAMTIRALDPAAGTLYVGSAF